MQIFLADVWLRLFDHKSNQEKQRHIHVSLHALPTHALESGQSLGVRAVHVFQEYRLAEYKCGSSSLVPLANRWLSVHPNGCETTEQKLVKHKTTTGQY